LLRSLARKFRFIQHLSRLRMQRYYFFPNCQNFSMFFFKKSGKWLVIEEYFVTLRAKPKHHE